MAKKAAAVASAPAPASNGDQPVKKPCLVGRKEFFDNAKPMLVRIGDTEQSIVLGVKEFSTGSFGWCPQGGEKLTFMVNGKAVRVQPSINFTVIGSKEVK